VGDRQRVCSTEACQKQRQRNNVAAWFQRNPDYPIRRRIRLRELRAAKGHPVDPLELPAPLGELPWAMAQKQFGIQGADFLGYLGRLLRRDQQKQMLAQLPDITSDTRGLPRGSAPKERQTAAP
jgi:hypothetical protein